MIDLDRLAAMTADEVAEAFGGQPDPVVTLHVVLRTGVQISGQGLLGLPETTAVGSSMTTSFDEGAILPEGVRPDVLAHLENAGLILAVHVPITHDER